MIGCREDRPVRLGRRPLLRGAAALALWATLASCGARSRVPHVGYLGSDSGPSGNPYVGAFRQGLREQGWVEGQDLVVDYRFAQGRLERLPELASELVSLEVDVIVASRDQAAHAAKSATARIAVVVADASDPVGSGLVASLSRPSGNVTGLTLMSAELGAKRLELLRDVVPGLSRVGVLWNPQSADKQREARELEAAARAQGLQVQGLEARAVGDFLPALRAATAARTQGLVVLRDALTFLNQELLVFLATESGLPSVYEAREFAEAGGLVAYGPNLPALYRRSAAYVRKIVEGARPNELPVERPSRFELVINLRTARTLGLTIPRPLLVLADDVIT